MTVEDMEIPAAARPPEARIGSTGPDRRVVLIMGTLLQVCLGTVYAWSYFQEPVVRSFHCTQARAAWAFSLAICFLGLAAAWGGTRLGRVGPRRLAMLGGGLYAAGWALAGLALAWKSLWLFWMGYGVVGGIGLGLGYVTPVATVARWFPDRKGLATGTVVMGFGLGALVMSKLLAPALIGWTGGRLPLAFALIGAILACGTLFTGWFMVNPRPAGAPAAAAGANVATEKGAALVPIASMRFALMWVVFFCNIMAGIMLIGFQSPMLQSLLKARRPEMTAGQLAAAGGTLIAISSIFNGLGRLFWGASSDRLGRTVTFRIVLGTQVLVFIALATVHIPWLFGALVCHVLLCYGGGFGAMPSFVSDVFGPQRMPTAYGAMLTAWSAAGLAGPQLAAAIRDRSPTAAPLHTFAAAAALLGAGFITACFIRNRA